MEEYLVCKGTKKSRILGWTATLGEILTMDNLRKGEKLLCIDAVCVRIVVSQWIIFFTLQCG